MKRSILAVIAALITWVIVVSLIDRVIRVAIPGYTAAEKTLEFTLAMKFARLLMAALTSIAAGAVAQYVSRANRWAAPIAGVIVLAMFLPVHIAIRSRLPLWYHLAFLLTIIPWVMLGAKLAPVSRSANLTAQSPSPVR